MKIVENKATEYLSINVSETETAWNSGSLYDYGDEVLHSNYIYAYAGEDQTNTTDTPTVVYERDKDIYPVWVRVRPSNYFAALDDKSITQTENADSIVMEFTNNSYDTVSLLNVYALETKIELIDLTTSDVIYTNTINMYNTDDIIDEQTYWYNEFNYKNSIYDNSIPLFGNTKIKITLTFTDETVKVGRVVLGLSQFIADTLLPFTLNQITYSRFRTDIFGNTDLIQGNSIKEQSFKVRAKVETLPVLERKRKELVATPLLFVMDESTDSKVENLLTYGYFQDAPFQVSNPTSMIIDVNIKSLL